MAAPVSASHQCACVEGFKRLIGWLFGRPEPSCRHLEEDRPITTQESADQASEDSFPASDPPSYTGSIT